MNSKRALLLGVVLVAVDYLWLALALPGENPLVAHAQHSQMHFWAFRVFTSLSHVALAAGLALYAFERMQRKR